MAAHIFFIGMKEGQKKEKETIWFFVINWRLDSPQEFPEAHSKQVIASIQTAQGTPWCPKWVPFFKPQHWKNEDIHSVKALYYNLSLVKPYPCLCLCSHFLLVAHTMWVVLKTWASLTSSCSSRSLSPVDVCGCSKAILQAVSKHCIIFRTYKNISCTLRFKCVVSLSHFYIELNFKQLHGKKKYTEML